MKRHQIDVGLELQKLRDEIGGIIDSLHPYGIAATRTGVRDTTAVNIRTLHFDLSDIKRRVWEMEHTEDKSLDRAQFIPHKCPVCSETPMLFPGPGEKVFYTCKCGLTGPYRLSKEHAAAAWNCIKYEKHTL